MCTNWDHTQTRDFEYLNSLWKENNYGEHNVVDAVENIGTLVRNELSIPVSVYPLDNEQSEFFKTVYLNSDRVIRKK